MTIYQIISATARAKPSSATTTAPGLRTGAAPSIRKHDAAEAHATRLRDRCPRNADLIKVEEIAAAND
jgi:hypothetical protein